ncbi:hypothetical protein IZ6_15290 [Terrihabitans soli]|uniref:Methyltransferase domain-containing protein n=1 Tax=Terrihabitans soli TaxID=708113 RepID=A0A6S6QKC5_9HYPH|nr:class I SAM-dependent methyltransferase [Terrihabitans soli]BCJ90794.1 hypothetical protein IZ6_15290 [Terrihabitans soli]
MGRKQRGATQRGQAGSSRPVFDSALAHLRANRLPEALALFKQVLALDPRHADSLYHLGSIALRIGHPQDAISLSRQTLALVADHAEAHRTLADALAVTGQLLEAEKHYERALALKPDAITYANLATIYIRGNNLTLAVLAVIRGLKIKETTKLRSLFVGCLQNAISIPADGDFRMFLTRAVLEAWKRPGDLAAVSLSLLKTDPYISAALARAVHTWPQRQTLAELYGQEGLSSIARDPLLRALLESTQFADIGLERLLTLTRSALLDAIAGNGDLPENEDSLAFFCALAQQCFINDYVFALSADEQEKVHGLGDTLNAAKSPDPHALAAFAAYQPLHTLASRDALQDREWPAPLRELFTRQVLEPLAERAMRGGIPQLTPIGNEISALVREQYEENPYPRWIKTASDGEHRSIDQHVHTRLPGAPYRPLGADATDILIAGCGTGQQVIERARAMPELRITAVDLSLTSLCYAKYRTEAAGIRNIEYGQADILELGSLGRSFDMIVCSGVLHHMQDPLKGWRTLLSLLRPNGVMDIALYSEVARADIVAAREVIARRGYGGSADDIRRARQDIMALDDSDPAKTVTDSRDFFGTSTCRDLLFHVQEERFTIPRIKRFLDEEGLEFLGFLLKSQQKRSNYAAPSASAGLDDWHDFETRHPAFFRGMYQFLVQKKS